MSSVAGTADVIPNHGMRMAAYDHQKAPYEQKAVAPNVLPAANSQTPAMNWAIPP